jgi:predicted DNA-binding transcriptional regulator AlpA
MKESKKSDPEFMTAREVMDLLKCSPSTLYRYTVREKKFPRHTITGKHLYKKNEVLDSIKEK